MVNQFHRKRTEIYINTHRMIYLRIIEKCRKDEGSKFDKVTEDFELGSCHSLLVKGETSEFEDEMENHFPETSHEGIRALLCAENGSHFFIREVTPFEQQEYYLMGETGKTYGRL